MSSADLFRSATSFYQARMLPVAVELDPYTKDGTTADELCDQLGLLPKLTKELLNGLCELELLQYHAGRYHSVGEHPHQTTADPLWTRVQTLLEAESEQYLLDQLEDEANSLRDYADIVDAHSAGCGPALAGAINWTSCHTVVDLGGTRGTVLAGLLAAQEHLYGVCFDLPAMAPLFAEHHGPTDRISFQAGDFFSDELPTADAYLLGHVLPDWDEERSELLIAKAAAALLPGGKILVYDVMLDPASPPAARNRLLARNTSLCTPDDDATTAADCRKWMESAGLTSIQVIPLTGATSPAETLVVANKPG